MLLLCINAPPLWIPSCLPEIDIGKDLVAASATPLVLAILSDGESYGYAIIKRVDELSGGRLQWTDGMLYPVLHRLERNGLVEATWGKSEVGPAAEVLPAHGPGLQRTDEPTEAVAGRERDTPRDPVPVLPTRSAGHLMAQTEGAQVLEERIDEWRSYVRRRQAIDAADIDELEDHLRSQVADLQEAGLDVDEAFLIGVKRIGELDTLSREFARDHSERLWKRLVVADAGESDTLWSREAMMALGMAVCAGGRHQGA